MGSVQEAISRAAFSAYDGPPPAWHDFPPDFPVSIFRRTSPADTAAKRQHSSMATQPLGPNGTPRASAKKRIRKIFGNIHEVVQMPNLIEVQRESYGQFLRSDPSTGYVSGLEKTLRWGFPVRDFAGTAELDFVNYELEDAKYDTDECRQRG